MSNLVAVQIGQRGADGSTDDGISYQDVGLPVLRYAPIANWAVHVIDLSAYSGQAIRLGFLAISAYGNNLFIDAVGISACGFTPTGVHFTFDPPLPQLAQPITFTGSIVTGTVVEIDADWVVVHAGFAIQVVDEQFAAESWEIILEMGAALDAEDAALLEASGAAGAAASGDASA